MSERPHDGRDPFARLLAAAGELGVDPLRRLAGYAKGLVLAAKAGPDDGTRVPVGSFEEAAGLADAYLLESIDAVCRICAEADARGGLIDHATLNGLVREQRESPSGLVSPATPVGAG